MACCMGMRICTLLPNLLAFDVADFFGGEVCLMLLMLLGLPLRMDSLRIYFGKEWMIVFSCRACLFASAVRGGNTADVLLLIT